MTTAQTDRIEAFLADYERFEFACLRAKARPDSDPWAPAHLAREIEAAYGLTHDSYDVHHLGTRLLRLLGRPSLAEKIALAPVLLAEVDACSPAGDAIAAAQIERMRAIVGDPDENNDDDYGDWRELRERLRAFVAKVA